MSAFEGQSLKPDVTGGATPLSRPFFVMAGNWGDLSVVKAAEGFGPKAIIPAQNAAEIVATDAHSA